MQIYYELKQKVSRSKNPPWKVPENNYSGYFFKGIPEKSIQEVYKQFLTQKFPKEKQAAGFS